MLMFICSVLFLNLCSCHMEGLCQGTPERRIFDKFIDPLDGCIQVSQLEEILFELHNYHETERLNNLGPGAKRKEFDEQDAREAEDQLSYILKDRRREALLRGSGGGTGIDYSTFSEWKRKYEEQKESKNALNVL